MDSPHRRKHLNEYLYVEYDQGEKDYPREKISEDWPYKLKYEGNWSIPNENDSNATVDIYLIHEEGKSQESNPDLYAYIANNAGQGVVGADETKGRSVEEYIKEEWEVEPKKLDSSK